jgi:signal transduction histidine kinase
VSTHEPEWPQRWARRRPELLAFPVAVFQLLGCYFAGRHGQPEARSFDALAVVLLVGSGLALFFRRRHPVIVLAVAGSATVLYHALAYPNGPFVIALAVAIFAAVRSGHRTAAWVGAGAFYVGYFVLARFVGHHEVPELGPTLGFGAWLLVVLVVADLVRVQRERVADAARNRAEEQKRRASEERLRVARELHDVLAHNISLINVQAGVALHLIDERPEQARTALAAIKQASKDALGELRSVLGVLRAPDDEAPRAPAPSLSRLEGLVSRAASAGLTVEVAVDGEPRQLPAPVDLAAFRIVQEALTNVTRHSGTARSATVHLRYDDEDLTVEIDDDGRGLPGRPADALAGTGSGIQGMRERAIALGGTLEAGPRIGGGFSVTATLPVSGPLTDGEP